VSEKEKYDLERAISEWRKPYEGQRRYSAQDIEELERHLRDEVENWQTEGLALREAFDRASKDVGEAWSGETEYRKVYWGKVRHRSGVCNELRWSLSMFSIMIRYYTNLAVRNAINHKTISLINIGGLAVGIACCILALAFVRYHLSWDQHHEKADRIFSIIQTTPSEGDVRGGTMGPVGPALETGYPEVEAVARIRRQGAWAMTEAGAFPSTIAVTDPAFVDIFDFTFLTGDRQTLFDRPLSIVITSSTARLWFGSADPIGEVVPIESYLLNGDYTVTGVIADPPLNASQSLRNFHILSTTQIGPVTAKSQSRQDEVDSTWKLWNVGSWGLTTFVLLRSPDDVEPLTQRLPELLTDHMGEKGAKLVLTLQPIEDVHLYGHLYGFRFSNALRSLYLVAGIAGVILLVACINFINLSTAHAWTRQREIGVRKTNGALRPDLYVQFLFESLITTSIASVFGVILAHFAVPFFRNHGGLNLPDEIVTHHIGFVPLLTVAVALLAGAYPSHVISSFHPVRALTARGIDGGKGRFRKALTMVQFVTCILLIVSTMVMYGQTNLLIERDLGFDRDLVIAMPIYAQDGGRKARYGDHIRYRWRTLNQTVLEHPNVISASTFQTLPGSNSGNTRVMEVDGKEIRLRMYGVDENFLDLFGLQLVAGKDFDREVDARTHSRRRENHEFILNESAVQMLGWDEIEGGPIGRPFKRAGWANHMGGSVVGVVKDFHFRGLRQSIAPLVLFYSMHSVSYMGVKVKPEGLPETLAFLESWWDQFLPERPFTYVFLDEEIGRIYRQEMQTARLMTDFSIIGILLGCMGLFGLTSFAVERRVKEIGIRKSLGASIADIVYRLSRESGNMLIAANLLAWPLGFYLLQQWLDQFVYRIDLHAGYFAFAGLVAALIALLTVALRAVPAARANPVDALRNE
jgi:putative ABC transport system permease protein